MYPDERDFDWRVREDAETLKRYAGLKSDPERLRLARECIKSSVDLGNAALGAKPIPSSPSRRSNSATIMKLKTEW